MDGRCVCLDGGDRIPCPRCGLLARGQGEQHEWQGQDVVDEFYRSLLIEAKAEQARGVPEVKDGD